MKDLRNCNEVKLLCTTDYSNSDGSSTFTKGSTYWIEIQDNYVYGIRNNRGAITRLKREYFYKYFREYPNDELIIDSIPTVKDVVGEQGSQMRRRFKDGMKQAIASRGKYKGFLKANCPSMGTDGAAVWQAITMIANPYKVGVAHLLFMDNYGKQLVEFTQTLIERSGVDVRSLDRDRNLLETLNIW